MSGSWVWRGERAGTPCKLTCTWATGVHESSTLEDHPSTACCQGHTVQVAPTPVHTNTPWVCALRSVCTSSACQALRLGNLAHLSGPPWLYTSGLS
jgi:hypothetical protein